MNLDRVEVADCRAWLAELPEDSIDLLMTSPPYWSQQSPRSNASTLECVWDEDADCQHEWSFDGSCTNCNAWKGELGLEPTQKMYVAHLLEIFKLVKKILKPTGSFYLNLEDARASTPRRRSEDNKGIPRQIEQGMLDNGWVLVDKSTWQKPSLISSRQRRRLKHSFELLSHFVKNRKTLLWHNLETGEWAGKKPLQRYKLTATMPTIKKAPIEDMTHPKLEERSLWQPFAYYYDLDAIGEFRGYQPPAEFGFPVRDEPKRRIKGSQFEAFPEEFCIRPILSSCPPEGIVADPFVGSGTTLLVAKKLRRHYVGCDLNPDYVKMARRRLADVKHL